MFPSVAVLPPGSTDGRRNMPTLDWEGQARKTFGIRPVWVYEEDTLHKHYVLRQWAVHSWYYYTGSPVPEPPEWGGKTTIMACYLCSCTGFLFGNSKVGMFLPVVPPFFAQSSQVPVCN